MPAQANNNAATGKSERAPKKSNPKSASEPSLRDLRRRLVGLRYELVRRLTVTVFMVGSAALLASHLNPWRLADEYPAAAADSRVAMSALAANARGAIAHAYDRAAEILPAGRTTAPKPAATVALASAAVTHPLRESAHRASRRRKIAHARIRHALVHVRASHQAAKAAAKIDTAASSVADGDAANWLMNRFPGEFDKELSKAYYKFLNFASSVIDLDWAPGLRDSIDSSMQSLTDSITSENGFSMSDLASLLKSIATSNGLIAFGAGLLLFTMLAGFSMWLRRAAGS